MRYWLPQAGRDYGSAAVFLRVACAPPQSERSNFSGFRETETHCLVASGPDLRLNLSLGTLLVVMVVAVNSYTMPAALYPGDPYWMMQEARSILLEGKLSIDDSPGTQEGQYFVRNPNNHRCYSKYGTMNGLLFTPPLFLAWKRDGQLTQIRTDLRPLVHEPLFCFSEQCTCDLSLCSRRNVRERSLGEALLRSWSRFTRRFSGITCGPRAASYSRYLSSPRSWSTLYDRRDGCPDPARHGASGLIAESVLSWVFLGALCFTKISNLVLVPVAWLAMLLGPSAINRKGHGFPSHTGMLIGSTASLAILFLIGWLDWTKFGSVWFTGYHQWKASQHSPSSINGVLGFLFDRQWSIFINYPPVFLALFGLTRFFRRFPRETLVLGGFFAASLLLIGSIPTWKGEWCYGPRYLLFLLPVVSLPFALVIEEVCHSSFSPRQALLIANCLLALGGSLYLQVQVNRLPFLAYYRVLPAAVLGQHRSLNLADSELSFFARKPVQLICYELVSNRDNAERLECFRDFCRRYPEADCRRYLGALTFVPALGNYYFE